MTQNKDNDTLNLNDVKAQHPEWGNEKCQEELNRRTNRPPSIQTAPIKLPPPTRILV